MKQKYRVIFVIEKVPDGEEPEILLSVDGPVVKFSAGKNSYGWGFGYFTKWELYKLIRLRLKHIGK